MRPPANPASGSRWSQANQPALAAAVAQSGPDNSFHFEGVSPGSYLLLASGPSHARGGRGGILGERPLFGRMQLDIGADISDISIPIQGGGSAALILQANHACVPKAELLLSPLEDWAAELDRTVTSRRSRSD